MHSSAMIYSSYLQVKYGNPSSYNSQDLCVHTDVSIKIFEIGSLRNFVNRPAQPKLLLEMIQKKEHAKVELLSSYQAGFQSDGSILRLERE